MHVERDLSLPLNVIQDIVQRRQQIHVPVYLQRKLLVHLSSHAMVSKQPFHMLVILASTSGTEAPSMGFPVPSSTRYVGIWYPSPRTELKNSGVGMIGDCEAGNKLGVCTSRLCLAHICRGSRDWEALEERKRRITDLELAVVVAGENMEGKCGD